MEKNKKKILMMVLAIVSFLGLIGGITYSWYTHSETGNNQEIIAGDIHLTYSEGNGQISISNIFPETVSEARSRNDNIMTFTVSGVNQSNKALYYEILLSHGNDVLNKYRYDDIDLRFDLAEIDNNGNVTSYLVQDRSYGTLDKTRIYVNSVAAGGSVNKRYMIRMWVAEDVLISDSDPNASYPATGTYAYYNHYGSVKVGLYGDMVQKGTTELYTTLVNANPTLDTGVNFLQTSVANNTNGLYKMASTASKIYPILYYRGELSDATINNNVYFAGFCWRIVRTTDTGGIKLIYNGTPTSDASHDIICDNTGANSQLPSTAKFNEAYTSPAYVGYMYGTVYAWSSGKESDGAYFGKDFEYGDFDENGTNEYRLKNEAENDVKVGIDATHHYTCNSTSITGTCTNLRYYYYYNPDYSDANYRYMYITLNNGKSIGDALNEMQVNTTNSNAKNQIDAWYLTNMINYTYMLEDTVWCNDRTVSSYGGWDPKGGSLTAYMYYSGVARRDGGTVNLGCPNKNDAFTVNSNKGNKMLSYPVGLLTSDEIVLAGGSNAGNTAYYLRTGYYYWSLSPFYFSINHAYEFYVYLAGSLYATYVSDSRGLRPSVSLRSGTTIISGDGDTTNPYRIG